MPYTLDLEGKRGDHFLRALPLTHPNGTPLTAAEALAIKVAYPVIEMQVRQSPGDPDPAMLTATSAAGELSIEVSYPQPDGSSGPAFVWSIPAAKCQTVIRKGAYDIQFRQVAGGDPDTWLEGKFTLSQDVSRVG